MFAACSKDSDENDPTKPIIKQGENNYITLYTEKQVGEDITMKVYGNELWVDLNNNGVKDSDESIPDGVKKTYKLKSQVFTLYGEITEFEAVESKLKSIDLSHATALKYLYLFSNDLTQLDLTKNTALKELKVSNNHLTQLSLSPNNALTKIKLYNNALPTKELLAMAKSLSTAPKNSRDAKIVLKHDEDSNVVTQEVLDVLSAKNWVVFFVNKEGKEYELNPPQPKPNPNQDKPIIKQGENNYITLYTEKEVGKEITIRLKGKEGVWIDLNNNGKKDEEDATPKLDGSDNTYLVKSKVFTLYGEITEFGADNCRLKGIDLSNATALTFLNLQSNNLTKLDLSANKNLKKLWVYYNQLEQLDLSQNTALESLDAYGNKLTQLDFSQNTALGNVKLHYNNFTAQAMLAMAKSLHKEEGSKNIALQGFTGQTKENNQVDKAVLDELGKKEWTAKFFKNGSYREYNGDPNAPNKP